jgi:probable HAF family extracellular repeat protein
MPGINNAGTIVGYYFNPESGPNSGDNAFSLSNGTYTLINYPGASQTWANGINDGGVIVGFYDNANGQYGFTLNNGVYTTLNYPGASGTEAFGINNAGDIVGMYDDSSGTEHGFEATPTPIPGAVLLFGPGLVGLAALRRRFKCATLVRRLKPSSHSR